MYQNRTSLNKSQKSLNNFTTEVIKTGDKYIVNYSYEQYTGMCEYHHINFPGQRKPLNQRVLLLTECEMGDIIEKINMDSPLSSEDLTGMTMEIREHSLQCVEDYIKSGGHHQEVSQ
jgi:hypothetical protein